MEIGYTLGDSWCIQIVTVGATPSNLLTAAMERSKWLQVITLLLLKCVSSFNAFAIPRWNSVQLSNSYNVHENCAPKIFRTKLLAQIDRIPMYPNTAKHDDVGGAEDLKGFVDDFDESEPDDSPNPFQQLLEQVADIPTAHSPSSNIHDDSIGEGSVLTKSEWQRRRDEKVCICSDRQLKIVLISFLYW